MAAPALIIWAINIQTCVKTYAHNVFKNFWGDFVKSRLHPRNAISTNFRIDFWGAPQKCQYTPQVTNILVGHPTSLPRKNIHTYIHTYIHRRILTNTERYIQTFDCTLQIQVSIHLFWCTHYDLYQIYLIWTFVIKLYKEFVG